MLSVGPCHIHSYLPSFLIVFQRVLQEELPSCTLVQCCSTYQDLVLIPLWATFGGAPCLSKQGITSKTTTDLANNILNNKNRDPSKLWHIYWYCSKNCTKKFKWSIYLYLYSTVWYGTGSHLYNFFFKK